MTHDRIASSFFSHDIFNPPNDRYRRTRAAHEDKVLDWLRQLLETESDACLQWPGPRTDKGYGWFSLRGVSKGAHVVLCDLRNGPASPDKPYATHRCGNGHLGCANPKHLRWGSAEDNADDTWYHRFLRNEGEKPKTRGVSRWRSSFVVDEDAIQVRLQSQQRDRMVGPIQTLGTVIKR